MAITSKAISDLVSAITSDSEDRKSNTYSAIVSRVDNEGVIWVRVAGSDKETPTASTSAEVKANDSVNVEWRNNKLYIAGNVSNPSAGSIRVTAVEQAAAIANQAAQNAVADAGVARQAAEEAQGQAQDATQSANSAQASANSAQTSADSAAQSANTALSNLGIIETVVGVLNLLQEHGEYEVTTDEEVTPDKWYFKKMDNGGYEVVNALTSVYHLTEDTAIDSTKTYYTRTGTGGTIYVLTEDEAVVEGKTYYTRSGSGTTEDPYVYTEVEEPTAEDLGTYYEAVDDPYVYTEVTNPDVADIGTYYEKYYELVSVDEAVQNYVSSHLVLSGGSLFLQSTGTSAKLELNTEDGVVLYGTDGKPRAQYGDNAIIGSPEGFHIKIDGTNNKIGFYEGAEEVEGQNEVAYMNSDALYVRNSLSFGSFIFYERDNGHFTLKKIDTPQE